MQPEVPDYLDDGAWFHGSPLELQVLQAGSTITRCRPVAEAFSHKPRTVGISLGTRDRKPTGPLEVTHDGTLPGLLYVVDEPVGDEDVHPHPNSSFPHGALEWVTDRPLRLRLIARLPA